MTQAVVITGAAGGIGQSLVKRFQAAGYWVIGLDLGHKLADIPCEAAVAGDLEKLCWDAAYGSDLIQRIIQHLGGHHLTALVNNAAVQIVKKTELLTPDDWQQTLSTNLVAPFVLSQALLPQLEANQGSIVNIASIHALLTKPEFVCYATSKAALVGLTRSMAVDLGGRVRVNAICPAAVDTPMLRAGFDSPEDCQQLSSMHPIGRIATPDDVAEAAIFLASQQAAFVTGSVFNLDGGIGNRLHDPV